MNNDDALEVEGRALPPIVISSIRTITPYLVGYVLAAVLLVLRPLGVEIPAQAEEWLGGVLPLLLGSLYYVAARRLEQRWPSVPWLGSRAQPTYTTARRAADDEYFAREAAARAEADGDGDQEG